MRKDTEIKFVGQPIFGQLLKLIDKGTFAELVREKKSDYYYKAFGSWDQLVTLLFGILDFLRNKIIQVRAQQSLVNFKFKRTSSYVSQQYF